MDYTWMLQISQTYELQAMYHEAQSATLEAVGSARAGNPFSACAHRSANSASGTPVDLPAPGGACNTTLR